MSDVEIRDGNIILKDLAFSTDENRVEAKGWIDLGRDSLDVTFAVVDANGCSIIEQRLARNASPSIRAVCRSPRKNKLH